MNRIFRFALGCAAVVFASRATLAVTTANWTNTAGGFWNAPANWDLGATYPSNDAGNTYNAVIGVGASPYSITSNTDITINSLLLNSSPATLSLTAGTFLLPAGVGGTGSISAGTLDLNGGSLTVNSSLAIGSAFSFRTGILGGSGVTTIATGGSLYLSNNGVRSLRTTLVNNGFVQLDALNGFTLQIGTFANNGTIQVNNTIAASTTTLVTGNGSFTQSGTLNINAVGTVAINATLSANAIFSNGTTVINSGTLALISNTLTFNNTNHFSGVGTLLMGNRPLTNNGTLNLAGHTNFAAGSLSNAGTVNISGAFDFNGGSISGVGTVNVLAGGSMNLGVGTTGINSYLTSTLNNAGTININASNATLTLASGTLNNSGYLNLDTGTFSAYGVYGLSSSLLRNTGTIVTSGTTIAPGAPMLISDGTLIANAQQTQLGYATTTFAGNSTIAGTGTTVIGSGYGIANTGTLNLAGHTQMSTGSITNSVSVVNISGQFDFGGGSINGGTVNVLSGGVLRVGSINFGSANANITGTLNNAGTINIDAATGTLSLFNGTLNNSSYLNIAGGTFTNYGVYGLSNSLLTNTGTIVTSGSTVSPAAPMLVNGGTIIANATNTQLGYATTAFAGNSTVTGTGSVNIGSGYGISNSGTLNLLAHTLMNSGSMTNAGTVNIVNQFDFGGGSFSGGTFNVLSGATMNVAPIGGGPVVANVAGTLNNSGTINVDAGNASLTLSSGTLNNAGYLNLNGGSFSNSGVFGLSNSLLRNTGTIVTSGGAINPSTPLLNNGGTIIANAGITSLGYSTINFAGTSTVAGTGTVTIGSGFGVSNTGTLNLLARTQLTSGSLSNSGTVNVSNRLDLNSGSLVGGTFNVLNGALLNVSSTGGNTVVGVATATLNNNGTINIDAGSASISLNNATLNNAAYLNINAGSFSNYGIYGFPGSAVVNTGTIVTTGGSINPAAPILNNGGTIVANANVTLLGFSTISFAGNSTVQGSGTVNISSGYAVSNAGTLNLVARTQISSGSLSNTGTVNLSNRLDFGGGSISGGTFNVLSGALLNVSSTGGTIIANVATATLNNNGTINIDANVASIALNGATLNNAGYLNLNGGSFSSYGIYGFPGSVLNNTGTIVTAGVGQVQPAATTVFNSGTLVANATQTSLGFATTSFAGSSTISGSGTVNFGGGYSINNSGTLNISALAQLSGGSLNNSGTVHFANALAFNGGTLAGSGAYIIDSGASMNLGTSTVSNLASRLDNLGTVNVIGNATLNISGATLNNVGTLNIGNVSSQPNVRFLSGGSLINNGTMVANLSTATATNYNLFPLNNVGTFVVSVGTVNMSSTIPQVSGATLNGGWVVNNNAALTFNGSPSFTTNNGSIVLGGANASMPSINTLTTNNGLFQLLNGRVFTTANAFTNSGTLGTDAGSTFTFNGTFSNFGSINGNIQTANLNLGGSGNSGAIESPVVNVVPNSTPQAARVESQTLAVGSNAQLSITPGGGTLGTSVVQNLDLTASNAKLNLNDHDLIVASGTSPGASLIADGPTSYTTILGYIHSGYNNDHWDGAGLNTAAAADGKHGLGIATAAMLFNGTGGVFSGQPVAASDVLVKYTYYGDTNLDGAVDIVDLGALAGHWHLAGDWIDGDFNYDGQIDIVDLGALAGDWHLGTTGSSMTFAEAMSLVNFTEPVPEPTAAGALALLMLNFASARTGRRTRRSSRTSASALRASGRSAA